jgi:hypothetical protein
MAAPEAKGGLSARAGPWGSRACVGAEGGVHLLGRGGAAAGGGRSAGLINVRDAAEIGGADGARRGPEGGPRAAGPWAVAVATRLVAKGGAQGWIVSAVRRGWAGPMEHSGGGAGGSRGRRALGGPSRWRRNWRRRKVRRARSCRRCGVVGWRSGVKAVWGRAGPTVPGSEAGAQVEMTNGFPIMGFNHAMRRSDRRLIPSGKPW